MSPITTHVLDTARGQPAEGVAVVVERLDGDVWTTLGRGTTNAEGRILNLLADATPLSAGVYRLRFGTGDYFRAGGREAFYPEVQVMVQLEGAGHYHLPLLLSPFGYTTYRGS